MIIWRFNENFHCMYVCMYMYMYVSHKLKQSNKCAHVIIWRFKRPVLWNMEPLASFLMKRLMFHETSFQNVVERRYETSFKTSLNDVMKHARSCDLLWNIKRRFIKLRLKRRYMKHETSFYKTTFETTVYKTLNNVI